MNIPLDHDFIAGTTDTALKSFEHGPRTFAAAAFASDMAALVIAGAAGFALMFPSESASVSILLTASLALAFATVAALVGLYRWEALTHPLASAGRLVFAAAVAGLLVAGGAALVRGDAALAAAQATIIGAALVLVARIVLMRVAARLPRSSAAGRNVVVIGAPDRITAFSDAHDDRKLTVITRVFPLDRRAAPPSGLTATVASDQAHALIRFARDHRVEDIVVAMDCPKAVAALVETLRELPVDVHLCGPLAVQSDDACEARFGAPTVRLAHRPISDVGAALKLITDYSIASVALLALLPLFAVIAAAIRIESRGPVFFRQERLGLNNQRFRIYKFRSMRHERAPEDSGFLRQATRDDDRITRVGRIIRATSLDELPQLINVLDGSMSLVGPRPHAMSHNDEYGRLISGYHARHRVKPGITGWAQVRGLRGETRDLSMMEARVRHDIQYADNWSLLLDMRILVMTALVVFFQKTAY